MVADLCLCSRRKSENTNMLFSSGGTKNHKAKTLEKCDFRPATWKHATFYVSCRYQQFVVSIHGGAKTRHAKKSYVYRVFAWRPFVPPSGNAPCSICQSFPLICRVFLFFAATGENLKNNMCRIFARRPPNKNVTLHLSVDVCRNADQHRKSYYIYFGKYI
jgi:hypothetical protein